jgi:hypothetical protein
MDESTARPHFPAIPRDTFKTSPSHLTQLHSELAGKIETNRKCLVTSYAPLDPALGQQQGRHRGSDRDPVNPDWKARRVKLSFC